MRLLPRIFKYYEAESQVEKYIFNANILTDGESQAKLIKKEDGKQDELEYLRGFLEELEDDSLLEAEAPKIGAEEDDGEEREDEEVEEEEEEQEPMPQKQVEELLENARRQAEEIRNEAKENAALMEKEAYTKGYERGSKEGFDAAHEEQRKLLEKEAYEFLMELESIVKDVEQKKVELLLQYRKDMKNIAIAVGEKVIQVSLKTSGDVIERMIESATEKLKRKEWMKVYIAKCDAEVLMAGDSQLMRNLSHISKHAKLIVMENETPGTCIIELPDEIIDASAQTQVANIKEILNNASM